MLLLAGIGLTGQSRDRRQLAAVGCAALAWTAVWIAATTVIRRSFYAANTAADMAELQAIVNSITITP